jgi:calcium-translocating P-type ATPase
MKLHHLGTADALASLHSQREGLAEAEAERRLAEFGENRIERLSRAPLWRRFLGEFSHLFALILWVAAGLALLSEWHDPGKGMALLGWAIVGVIVVNGLFSFLQEYRAERVLASLEALLPKEVSVVRQGVRQRLPSTAVVPGDIVLLREGDAIPADCLLVESRGVRVSVAAITGESGSKVRAAGSSPVEDLLQASNVLLAGTEMVAGEAMAVVFASGGHTEFGKIARLSQHPGTGVSPLYLEIARLSRVVAVLAVTVGSVFFVLGLFVGQPFRVSFVFAIGIIVALVPEGLLPTLTLSLSMAARRMARRHALVRHLPAVETLGEATVILSDKTGTLTANRMAVQCLWLGGPEIPPEAVAGQPGGSRALDIAVNCHSLEWLATQGIHRGDPMEVALLQLAPERARLDKLDELPFDADRKRMSTLHAAPDGRRLFCKGALEQVLPLCNRIQFGAGARPLDATSRTQAVAVESAMAERGLRVLALAWRPVGADEARGDWERDLIFVGLVGLADPPRPEVAEAVRQCRQAGIRVIMATGDHPRTALAVARAIGLAQDDQVQVMTGEELRRLSPTQLRLALERRELLFARLLADQKMVLVQALQAKGHLVAVTGDGVNDAPALRAADIGVAMGQGGTDVAREAADLVLLDDNFATIVAAIEEGRAVRRNIRKFLTYMLSSNVPELVPYLAFVLFRIPLPLTVIQVLMVDLGTDMLPALGLGAERPDPQLMREPPHPRGQRLMSNGLLLRAFLFLGPLEAVAAMAAFFFVLHGGGWTYGQALAPGAPLYLQATTATLAAIIVLQAVNVFLCRDPRRSALANATAPNPLILLGVAVELALIACIAYTPWGNRLLGSAPLEWRLWVFLVPFAIAMLALEEARKAWLRRWRPQR